jgi:hypothetical protein
LTSTSGRPVPSVGVHELHRRCTTHASSSPALLLGFAFPSESDLITATRLIAEAICLQDLRHPLNG